METRVKSLIKSLSMEYGFNPEEAWSKVVESWLSVTPVVRRVLLPWSGEVKAGSCQGIRVNHGLYTQCVGKQEVGDYCKTCAKSAASNGGIPKYGRAEDRSKEDYEHKSKVVRYSQVMEKLGISREEAEAAAKEQGCTIGESEFEPVEKGRRGRPRKHADTSSSDSDGEPKKRGRPRKKKEVVPRSTGEDLIASLMEAAQLVDESSDSGSDQQIEKEAKDVRKVAFHNVSLENAELFESDVLSQLAEKEAAKEAAKQAKLAEKEAAKQAKLAEKEAAKQAKLAEKEAAKQAKLEAKEAEKQAKLAEKEAEKQAKLEAKEAAKQAKLAEKEAAKEAAKQAKLEAKEAAKQAKLAEKEAEKQAKLEAKEAEKQAKLEANEDAKLEANEAAKEEEIADDTNEVDTEDSTASGEDTIPDAPTLNIESEEEEEEEDCEDDCEVEECTLDGIDYILDPSSGTLYDKDAFEEDGTAMKVGTYDASSETVTLF